MLSAGTQLGPYEVIAPLGAGGVGEVYRARDMKLNRDVAVKTPRPEVAADPERIERFMREARAVASLNHPSIVTPHSIEEADGTGSSPINAPVTGDASPTQNRVLERQRLPVVHQPRSRAHAPERRRPQPVPRARPAVLDDAVAGADVVQHEVAERVNSLVAQGRWDGEYVPVDQRAGRRRDVALT